MNLTPKRVRQLIEIAFTLEPLLNKKDCSTRYSDLPGKPITDFVVAGLNTGSVFEKYAESIVKRGNKCAFSHFPEAIKISNEYKSKKVINKGLLEFMFLFLAARFKYHNLQKLLNKMVDFVKATGNKDVLYRLKSFQLALTTSKSHKLQKLEKNYKYFSSSQNIYQLYERIAEKSPDPTESDHQAAKQYLNGFPIVQRYIAEIDENKGILKSIEDTYDKIHEEDKMIKVGILADLSAVSLFLYLSFKNTSFIIK